MKSLTNYLRAYRWQDHTTTIIIQTILIFVEKGCDWRYVGGENIINYGYIFYTQLEMDIFFFLKKSTF
jgi:hypothetical protein